ncbi:MAG: hypothetical protein FD170_3928 [Bacteroidetes bacterium]|nr:MAG: hypothetical protein FD170_3928 [Bacteroidota bacterium]
MKKNSLILLFLLAAAMSGLLAQNAPITTAGSVVSTGSTVVLPITVTNFNNITSCNLEFFYDPAIIQITSVTPGSLLSPSEGAIWGLDYNNSTPGVLYLQWYIFPNISVPNNYAIFNITVSKVSAGTSAITWSSDEIRCNYYDQNYAPLNDSPLSSYYFPGSVTFQDFAPTTIASSIYSCPGTNISVPVKVNSFNTIGGISLTLNYDPAVLTYLSGNNTSGFPGIFINPLPGGTIIIGGFTTLNNGVTYPDNTTLFTLNFTYNGGTTNLSWIDDGSSCDYQGPSSANYPTLNDSPQSTYYINGFVGPSDNTQWNGNTNAHWNTQTNWTCGIPHSGSNVIIPITPNNPAISSSVVINSLTINSGASLTLNPEASLTVSSSITNNAGTDGLLLESSATATASLIHHNTGVLATVERFIARYDDINDYMFHFISSPVVSQPIRTEFVTATPTYAHDFYAFSEPENMWINTKADDGSWNNMFEDNFVVGKGYLIAYPTDVVKTFTGELNSIPASSPLVKSCTNTAVRGEGWNLLGNPFPSALDWNLLILGDGMDNALYYYNNDEENYGYYLALPDAGSGYLGNGTQFIPPMQGFMVHAKSTGTKTVSISDDARSHSGKDTYYKSGQSVPGSMSLTVSTNGKKDETFIHFNNQATTAFDGEYDAYKLKSYSSEVPKIYTIGSDNNELAINGLPELSGDMTIPVYFEAAIEGTYTLTANLEQLQGTQVLLEDKTENTTRNISQNPVYTFSASPGENANRFILKFGSVGIGDIDPDADIKIYTVDKNIVINAPESSKLDITVYNLTGQLMLSSKSNGGQITLPAGNLSKGVYLVSVVNNGKVVNRKIVISQ